MIIKKNKIINKVAEQITPGTPVLVVCGQLKMYSKNLNVDLQDLLNFKDLVVLSCNLKV